MQWSWFFPPGTRVAALPNWSNPRLFISAENTSTRWIGSGLYPASRRTARLYRLLLRLRSALIAPAWKTSSISDGWSLGELVAEVWPQAATVAVLVGTAGPAQKWTVQVFSSDARTLGFVKVAEQSAARVRVRREFKVLRALPPDVGPEAVKLVPWKDGMALLTTALEGRAVSVSLPPSSIVSAFCGRLVRGEVLPPESHPWIQRQGGAEQIAGELEVLHGRSWPVVVQHGDLTAWNLRRHRGVVRAFDWEYGDVNGFPHLDLAYYIQQHGALIYRWTPEQAFDQTRIMLVNRTELTPREAEAISRLAAYDAHTKSAEDGHPPTFWIQAWRRQIYER